MRVEASPPGGVFSRVLCCSSWCCLDSLGYVGLKLRSTQPRVRFFSSVSGWGDVDTLSLRRESRLSMRRWYCDFEVLRSLGKKCTVFFSIVGFHSLILCFLFLRFACGSWFVMLLEKTAAAALLLAVASSVCGAREWRFLCAQYGGVTDLPYCTSLMINFHSWKQYFFLWATCARAEWDAGSSVGTKVGYNFSLPTKKKFQVSSTEISMVIFVVHTRSFDIFWSPITDQTDQAPPRQRVERGGVKIGDFDFFIWMFLWLTRGPHTRQVPIMRYKDSAAGRWQLTVSTIELETAHLHVGSVCCTCISR